MDNNDVNLSGIDIFGESIKDKRAKKEGINYRDRFKDAHQSLMATRMRTEDMLSVAAKMDEIGYYSFEMWGGATLMRPCVSERRPLGALEGAQTVVKN